MREGAGLQTELLLPALAITHTLLTAEETTACQDVQRISSAAPHVPGEVREAGMCGMPAAASPQGSAGGTGALPAAHPVMGISCGDWDYPALNGEGREACWGWLGGCCEWLGSLVG